MNIVNKIATELGVADKQVEAAIALLDEGATVPFIARYRKEVTGGLDDTQLRALESRLSYLREFEDRRNAILKSIEEQGKLTPELKKQLLSCDTKTELEDLYLPYKPRRVTKGQIAIENGLEPFADKVLEDADVHINELAHTFINDKFADVDAVLEGARFIIMERYAQDALLIGKLRDYIKRNAVLESRVVEGKEESGAKFQDYFDYKEDLTSIPSHRMLALLRGRDEGVLSINVNAEPDVERMKQSACEDIIKSHAGLKIIDDERGAWLKKVVRMTWRVKLLNSLETEFVTELKSQSEEEAIKVFGTNLKDLLLAAPAGDKVTMGLDPGLRTGTKVAVVDGTGKLLATETIYPHAPQNQWERSLAILGGLVVKHSVSLIAIGNGTASRETDRLAGELLKLAKKPDLSKIIVSEAGASVYSASEFASNEFPDLDVSLRGAVSIARRLQDPLAELVKIEPKAIGVGQYQHDVCQRSLSKSLDAVVEDCVNSVGVDLNTASIPLLARVSGLNSRTAQSIVEYRDLHGGFKDRQQIKDVPRLGNKAFEQCAGFLRIAGGKNLLDNSCVHPESYEIASKIVSASGLSTEQLVGNADALKSVDIKQFVTEAVGVPTLKDIVSELSKPSRDPRPEFKTAAFKEGVEDIKDLKAGMILEGVVSNVTNFGAFVDLGVHQDGLVHISAMSDKFIKDPREVVKAGDVVKVKVISVDLKQKRIEISMRLSDEPTKFVRDNSSPRGHVKKSKPMNHNAMGGNSAMADALKSAMTR